MTPHFGMCQWETLGVRLKIGNGFFNPTRIGDFNPTLTMSNTNDSKKRHVAHRREIRFFVRYPYYLKLKVVIPYTGFLSAY